MTFKLHDTGALQYRQRTLYLIQAVVSRSYGDHFQVYVSNVTLPMLSNAWAKSPVTFRPAAAPQRHAAKSDWRRLRHAAAHWHLEQARYELTAASEPRHRRTRLRRSPSPAFAFAASHRDAFSKALTEWRPASGPPLSPGTVPLIFAAE